MFHRPLLLLTILTSALFCYAQNGPYENNITSLGFRSTLTGSVRDTAGHPINGARIELMDTNTGRNVAGTFSLANGTYELTNIRNGVYEITASAGLVDSRTRVEVDSDREISFNLAVNTNSGTRDGAAVSLSQMKVPGKARRMLEKAEEAFHKAHLDEAFSFVQQALGFYPDYAKALTLRGILNMQKGDNKDAQPDLEKAVQLDYGDDMGFVALASLYNNEGQFDHAQQTLEHGMALNPKSWQATMEMARAQIGKKDFAAALRSLDRLVSIVPPSVTVHHLYRAQAFIGLKDMQGAIGELETYLTKEPVGANSAQARTALAQLKGLPLAAQK